MGGMESWIATTDNSGNGVRATTTASASTAAFGSGAATMGVFFERPGEADRTATAGWYNTAAFETEAKAAGLYARSFNGDAYSDAIKAEVIAAAVDGTLAVRSDWVHNSNDSFVYTHPAQRFDGISPLVGDASVSRPRTRLSNTPRTTQ